MIEIIRLFFQFLSKPNRLLESNKPREAQFKELIQLFLFVFAMVIFIAAPIIVLVGGEQLPNKISELTDFGFDSKAMQFAAMFGIAVVFAPLIEELIFRFPLKYRRGALVFGAAMLGMFLAGILKTLGVPFNYAAIIGAGLALIGYFASLLRLKDGAQLDEFVVKLFPYLFYASALVFAYVHISNYDLPADKWYITPALVLPQFFLGLMLGYARIKYGLWAAIFLHAMNNLIPTIAMFMMPEVGGM